MRAYNGSEGCGSSAVRQNARMIPAGPADVRWCAATLVNRLPLAAELGLGTDGSSADVVAAAFDRWGSDAPRRLLGAWAIARRGADGTLTMWRDGLGLMPAYWAVGSSGQLHIGDSLVELARTGDVDAGPDDEFAFARSVHATGLLPTATSARGIRRVPPGSSQAIPDGRPVRWWRPEDVPRTRVSVDEAARELRSLLVTAIAEAVLACPPAPGGGPSRVAAHLSGGLDSTVVAFEAQRVLRDAGSSLDAVLSWSPEPSAVTFAEASGDEPLAYDERDLITTLAADLGVPVVFGPATMAPAPWLADTDPATQPDETLGRESHLLPLASAIGVRHILSGWGGDEFASFNGRGTTRALVRGARVRALHESYARLRAGGLGRVASARHLARDGLPQPLRRRANRPAFQQRWDAAMRAAADRYPELAAAYWDSRHALERAATARDLQLALIAMGHLARRVESWHEAGRRFGVDYHFPLLDLRLVEWSLSAPPEAFRVGRHSRRVFRLAVAGLVPESVRMTAKEDPVLLRLLAQDREQRRAQEGAAGG